MKKRLVGTVVLGSVALIIISLLLDGEGMAPAPITATIPPAPVINTTPIPDPVRPVIIADEPAGNRATNGGADDTVASEADGGLVSDAGIAVDDDYGEAAIEDQAAAPASTAELADTEEPVTEAGDDNAAAPAAGATTTASSDTAATQARLDEQGLPEAWTVRLGSFGNKANADALVRRLVAADHKAYLRPVQAGDRVLNGVFVGPVLTRREANALKAELLMSFELDGLVQQFELEP